MTIITLHFDDSLKHRKERLKNKRTWQEVLEKGVSAFEAEVTIEQEAKEKQQSASLKAEKEAK